MIKHIKPNYDSLEESAKVINDIYEFLVKSGKPLTPHVDSVARVWFGNDNLRKCHIFINYEDDKIQSLRVVSVVEPIFIIKSPSVIDDVSVGDCIELDNYVSAFKRML